MRATMMRTMADRRTTGQHSQDEEHLLQGQGVPKAHRPQGHAVQGWQGMFTQFKILPYDDAILTDTGLPVRVCILNPSPSTMRDEHSIASGPMIAPSAPMPTAFENSETDFLAGRVSADMTASRVVMVVRPSPSSTRRRRPRRRSCSGWSA